MKLIGVIIFATIVIVSLFILVVELSYRNKPSLKFHNDEIDVSDVDFQYRDISDILEKK